MKRPVRFLAMAAAVLATAACGASTQHDGGRPPRPHTTATVYVLSQAPDQVTAVNALTGAIGRTIRLVKSPNQFQLTPDGRTAVAMNDDSLMLVDVASGAVRTVAVSLPRQVVVLPDSRSLDVLTYPVGDVPGQLVPVTVATGAVGRRLAVGRTAAAMALAPDGRTVYVLRSGEQSVGPSGVPTFQPPGSVLPVDTATGTARREIALSTLADSIAVTPDGRTAYVTTTDSVTPIDTATGTAGAPIALPGDAIGLTINPDGRAAYVLCLHATIEDGAGVVVPIDVASNRARKPITVPGVGKEPAGISAAPGGKRVYVLGDSQSDAVGWVDTTTDTTGPALRVGRSPQRIAYSADGATAWVLNGTALVPVTTGTGAVGKPISLPPGPVDVAAGT